MRSDYDSVCSKDDRRRTDSGAIGFDLDFDLSLVVLVLKMIGGDMMMVYMDLILNDNVIFIVALTKEKINNLN